MVMTRNFVDEKSFICWNCGCRRLVTCRAVPQAAGYLLACGSCGTVHRTDRAMWLECAARENDFESATFHTGGNGYDNRTRHAPEMQ